MPPNNTPPDPIEAYLNETIKLLRRHLPAQLASQRVAEAREHLKERAVALVASGIEPIEARNDAVAAFGPAGEWARSVAQAAYGDPGALKAHRLSQCAVLLAFIACPLGSFWPFVLGNAYPEAAFQLECWVTWAAVLVLAAAAFRARRSIRPVILGVAVIVTLASFVLDGIYFTVGRATGQLYNRSDIASELPTLPLQRADYQSEYHLFNLGVKTYDRFVDPARYADLPSNAVSIPAELRTPDGGYIVPIKYSEGGPFKDFTMPWWFGYSYDTYAALLRAKQEAPYSSVGTPVQAAIAWKSYGEGRWLCYYTQWHTSMENLRLAKEHREGFSWKAGLWALPWKAIFCAALLGLDMIMVYLGRRAFLRGSETRNTASA